MSPLTLHPRPKMVAADLVAKYADLAVTAVSDSMDRLYGGGASLRPVGEGARLAGPAFTVKTRPGDNLAVHKALELAHPGDVIVVDAGGELANAIIGELMVTYARTRGIAGFVVHGAIRDREALAQGPLPVFAAGVIHKGPYKDGPGVLLGPIALDGMVIQPGDLILGDDDGVLCVPQGEAEALYPRAAAKHQADIDEVEAALAGRLDRRWLERF